MSILITGATGNVSSALLAALPDHDGVRVLVRDAARAPEIPGVEVAVGDLERPETLEKAFDGIDTLWLLTAMGPLAPHASSNAVWAARRAGVKHVVRLSAIGAAHDAPTRNGRLHALSDAELAASGLGWTVIKPHFFMQNLLGAVSGGTLYGMTGEGRLGFVDVRDIADFAAAVLAAPDRHHGKTYTLTGPESISLREAAARLEPVLGTPVAYQPVTPEQAYRSFLGFGAPDWVAAVSAKEYGPAYAAGWGDYTTTDFTDVTGRPGRAWTDFARDHADLLRGA
ncbi:SDR family oxidoreductase [Bailinhaonella thermotolerans]|uniref:SDR family oxidoreductase n=1 Tax=Bailinhaonella thermotolerans TaxID=1070861 RepID=A0A3A4ABM1_9ACTN|nr:SDR family oxidoreductase [Bailinhaonella thermotolerans]RJL24207.1 SDR family oxidoreductase [Bailinhaonella thermotolerans]